MQYIVSYMYIHSILHDTTQFYSTVPQHKSPGVPTSFSNCLSGRGKKVREKTRRHRGKQHQRDARVAMTANSKKSATTNEDSGDVWTAPKARFAG
jgi:hypothetical protein